MQKITVTGNIVKDAERRRNSNGKYFVVFRVACDEKWLSGTETTYYDITCADGKRTPYLTRGTSVTVTGTLRVRIAEGNNGNKYVNLYIYPGLRDISINSNKKAKNDDEKFQKKDFNG